MTQPSTPKSTLSGEDARAAAELILNADIDHCEATIESEDFNNPTDVSLDVIEAAITLARTYLTEHPVPTSPPLAPPANKGAGEPKRITECVRDMLDILESPDATEDEKSAAAATIVEAVAPEIMAKAYPATASEPGVERHRDCATDRDHRIIDSTSVALEGRIGSEDDVHRLVNQIKCGGGTKDKLETACEIAIAFIRWAQDLKHRATAATGETCNGCNKPLSPENAWMEDGCPCNSIKGCNDGNQTISQWRQEEGNRLRHEVAGLRFAMAENVKLKTILTALLRCPEVRAVAEQQWINLLNMDYGDGVDSVPLVTAIDKALEFVPQAWLENDEKKQLQHEIERLKSELAMWKPLSPAEAEAALEAAVAIPISDERINAIIERVTDPAYRPSEPEHVMLAAKVKQLIAERDATIAANDKLRRQWDEQRDKVTHFQLKCEGLQQRAERAEQLVGERPKVIHGGPSVVLPKGGYVCMMSNGEACLQFSTGKGGSSEGYRYVRVDQFFAE